jgi:hypothetical protein
VIIEPTCVVQHVHFQIRLVDEGFVAARTFNFGFGLMIADRVELQGALSLKVGITLAAFVRLVGAVSVLCRERLVNPPELQSSN